MNLLMFSGDSSVAQGRGGAFADMLRRFAAYWSRLDILTPTAPGAADRVLYENVYIHPSPWHRALQPLFIRRKGEQLLAERRYDLVVSHDFGFFYNGIGAWWLLRGKHIPLVSEIHHVEGYPLAVTWREKAWRAVAVRYLPWAAGHVAAFRVVNQREVPLVLRRLGIPDEKILVLSSLYLDLTTYQPQPARPKEYDVLFVGRLAANKGIDLLLEAFRQVLQTHPAARLALRGEGALHGQIARLIQTQRLQNNVLFLPRVSDAARMADVYNAARMLVCASTVEGNPRVTIEAMACGVPVLSTAVGIMPEVIHDGENGFLFDRSPTELAAKIRRLLDDAALRSRIGEAGRQSVQRFEAENVIAAYAKGYHDLVQRCNASRYGKR